MLRKPLAVLGLGLYGLLCWAAIELLKDFIFGSINGWLIKLAASYGVTGSAAVTVVAQTISYAIPLGVAALALYAAYTAAGGQMALQGAPTPNQTGPGENRSEKPNSSWAHVEDLLTWQAASIMVDREPHHPIEVGTAAYGAMIELEDAIKRRRLASSRQSDYAGQSRIYRDNFIDYCQTEHGSVPPLYERPKTGTA